MQRLWRKAPHPVLAEAYAATYEGNDPLKRVQRLKKLSVLNPDHPESKLALAQATLDAGLWEEVRSHLGTTADGPSPSRRVCLMMAELEERGNGNPSRAREWRDKAAQAHPDTAWVCGHCNAVAEVWASRCGQCSAFAAIEWRLPGGDKSSLAVDTAEIIFSTMAVLTGTPTGSPPSHA